MKTLWKLLRLSKSGIYFFLPALILQLFMSIYQYFYPKMIGDLVDGYFAPFALGKTVDGSVFWNIFHILLLLTVAYMVAGVIANMLMCKGSVVGQREIRRGLFRHLLHLPFGYFDNEATGSVINRLTSDTSDIGVTLYPQVLIILPRTLLAFAAVIFGIFQQDVRVGLCALFVLPFILWFSKTYSNIFSDKFKACVDCRSEVSGLMSEIIHLHEGVQANGWREPFLRKLRESLDRRRRANVDYNMWDQLFYIPLTLAQTMLPVAFVLGMLWVALDGMNITAGMIISIITYMRLALSQLDSILGMFPIIVQSMAAGKRVLQTLELPLEADAIQDMERTAGPLCFSHVDFSYIPDRPILQDVSFTIDPHKSVAFVGETGSGKSTIISLMMRYRDATGGQISLGGKECREVSRKAWRKSLALVQQDPMLFEGTLYDNLCLYQTERVSREKAEWALQHIVRDNPRFREGLDLPVKSGGANFSAGEKQLIAMARVLAFDAPIFIMDEATATIDPYTEALITDALRYLQKDRTMVLVAHRLSTVRQCDTIFVLDEGSIVEEGNHDSLMEKGGLYAKFVLAAQENV